VAALYDNTTGSSNTAIGRSSLANNTSASYNAAVGDASMNRNTTGYGNAALGWESLYSNTTGALNVAIGRQAMRGTTTGGDNVGVGYRALYSNTTGTDNTALGKQAGHSVTTGTFNTFLGHQSGYNMQGSKNTIVGPFNGNQGGLDIRTTSSNIVLSDGDGNPRGFFHGGATSPSWQFVNPTASQYAVKVNNSNASTPNGLLVQHSASASDNNATNFIVAADQNASRFVVTNQGDVLNHDNSYGSISDVKLKDQIEDASSQWQDVKDLTIRKYKMKSDIEEKGDSDDHWRLGVVAQELEASGMSGLVYETPDKDADMNDLGTSTKAVKYSILYMKAVKALQEAMARIETLETKVAALEG